MLLQPHVKQHSLKRPKDLIIFPWESEQSILKTLSEQKAWDIFPDKL